MSKKSLRTSLLKDLEAIYALALAKGNLTAALRAKELLGKGQGFFASPSPQKKVSLAGLSDEDINDLIQEIDACLTKKTHKKET